MFIQDVLFPPPHIASIIGSSIKIQNNFLSLPLYWPCFMHTENKTTVLCAYTEYLNCFLSHTGVIFYITQNLHRNAKKDFNDTQEKSLLRITSLVHSFI